MINWDNKTSMQKILSIFEYDVKIALDNALQYKYLLEAFYNNSVVNVAPVFFSSALYSFRYSLIMRSARIFDESKDSYGFNKILNKLEMTYSTDLKVTSIIYDIRKEYENYKPIFNDIRSLRDKVFAHNDNKIYRGGDSFTEEDAIDKFDCAEFEKVLRWTLYACQRIEIGYGDEPIPYRELVNDIKNLIVK